MVRRAERKWEAVKDRESLSMGFALAPALIGVIAGVFLMTRAHLPFGPVSYLFIAFMASIGSVTALLSQEVKTVLSAVRKPPALKEWVDIYASSDPVPNGPTLIDGDMGPRIRSQSGTEARSYPTTQRTGTTVTASFCAP